MSHDTGSQDSQYTAMEDSPRVTLLGMIVGTVVTSTVVTFLIIWLLGVNGRSHTNATEIEAMAAGIQELSEDLETFHGPVEMHEDRAADGSMTLRNTVADQRRKIQDLERDLEQHVAEHATEVYDLRMRLCEDEIAELTLPRWVPLYRTQPPVNPYPLSGRVTRVIGEEAVRRAVRAWISMRGEAEDNNAALGEAYDVLITTHEGSVYGGQPLGDILEHGVEAWFRAYIVPTFRIRLSNPDELWSEYHRYKAVVLDEIQKSGQPADVKAELAEIAALARLPNLDERKRLQLPVRDAERKLALYERVKGIDDDACTMLIWGEQRRAGDAEYAFTQTYGLSRGRRFDLDWLMRRYAEGGQALLDRYFMIIRDLEQSIIIPAEGG